MSDCIFCKIINSEIPCYKIYEDNLFLGFLDIKPLNIGNSLLIPKNHHRWVTDVPEFGQYWETAKKIALATKNIVNADYISFLTLGMEVEHAHIRIIPRFYEDKHTHGINTEQIVNQTSDEMILLASKIFRQLK